jgi:hypothetical protein
VFAQIGASRNGGSYSTTDHLTKTLQGLSVDFYDPGYTTYDAALGVSKDAWSVGVYAENLTDVLGVPYSSYAEWVKANTVIRPRTVTFKFSYSFSDKK